MDSREALGDSEGLEFTTVYQYVFLFKIAQCIYQPVSLPVESSRSLYCKAYMVVHFCIRTMVAEEGSHALCSCSWAPGLGTNVTFAPEKPNRCETILCFVNQFATFLQPIYGLDLRVSPTSSGFRRFFCVCTLIFMFPDFLSE